MGIGKELITKPIKQILTKRQDRHYEKQLAVRRVSYDSWVKAHERNIWQEKLNEDSFRAEDYKTDAIEIFCMPRGRMAEQGEALIRAYFAEHPKVQIAYGDEDVWQGEQRSNPWYKPDWSPDLFDSRYYFGSVVAVRWELLEQLPCPVTYVKQDGVNVLMPGEVCGDSNGEASQQEQIAGIRKWVRGLAEACGGWQRGCVEIGHVGEILYHCNALMDLERYLTWQGNVGNMAADDGAACRKNAGAGDCAGEIQLSIMIPSKDNPQILENCLKGIRRSVGKLSYEIIIVDNGSREENRQRIETMVQRYEKENFCAVKYIYTPMEFNFSRMCNLGAGKASGSLLLFLNDDVELCGENCLSEMAELAGREYTGAVGLKLYYPDSQRIQHAGITNLPMGPVHKLQFLMDDEEYYFHTNRGLRNVLAVTAACLMVEKKKFWEVQGFAEDLQVAFNDVDFCFSLYESGYVNVCDNRCYAFHHESLSRGDDESTERWQRLLRERDMLYRRHPQLAGRDPYYGAGLGREGLDTRIRPEYETAGNKKQLLSANEGVGAGACLSKITSKELASFRQDNCLLLRVEECRHGILQGYGVVLGDDNACYEKRIVLEAAETSEGAEAFIYTIPVEGQYRPDLTENMPDQINVGLSGFWMISVALKKGSYRIGMTARNRVTGLRLINWSSRIFTVEKQ